MRFGVRGFGRRAAARPGRGRCDVRRCGPAGPRHRGQQIAVGVCGDGVHGAGAVVVGQDHSEVVGGAVFGAAAHLVDACVGAVVMLVGFVGDGRINRQVVFVAAPSHADISHGTTRTIGQNRPADSSLIHPCFAPVRSGIPAAGSAVRLPRCQPRSPGKTHSTSSSVVTSGATSCSNWQAGTHLREMAADCRRPRAKRAHDLPRQVWDEVDRAGVAVWL